MPVLVCESSPALDFRDCLIPIVDEVRLAIGQVEEEFGRRGGNVAIYERCVLVEMATLIAMKRKWIRFL